jgi:hypothetical protein
LPDPSAELLGGREAKKARRAKKKQKLFQPGSRLTEKWGQKKQERE